MPKFQQNRRFCRGLILKKIPLPNKMTSSLLRETWKTSKTNWSMWDVRGMCVSKWSATWSTRNMHPQKPPWTSWWQNLIQIVTTPAGLIIMNHGPRIQINLHKRGTRQALQESEKAALFIPALLIQCHLTVANIWTISHLQESSCLRVRSGAV